MNLKSKSKKSQYKFINAFHDEVYERVPWHSCLWYSLIWLFSVPILLVIDNIKHIKIKNMSHPAQRAFIREMRRKFNSHFIGANVIDCGSKNINGSNRRWFRRYLWNWLGMNSYIGIDIDYGDNVDIVGAAHRVLPIIAERMDHSAGKLRKPKWPIDIVISTEMLEHDKYWRESLYTMYDILRPGGLLIITAAGNGRPEHGTNMHHPSASPATLDYYHNISNDMFRSVLSPRLFEEYIIRQVSGDFQFAGIKKTNKERS